MGCVETKQIAYPSNTCGNYNEGQFVYGYCGYGIEGHRSEVCDSIGNDEWTNVSWSSMPDYSGLWAGKYYNYGNDGHAQCSFTSCDYYHQQDVGCCNGCCGIIGGSGLVCKRRAFNGNPISCAFQDKTCSSSPSACWDGSDTKFKTCHPQYRDMTTQESINLIIPYCRGDDIPQNPTSEDIVNFIARWLYKPTYQDLTGHALPTGITDGAAPYTDIYGVRRRGDPSRNVPSAPCQIAMGRYMFTDKMATVSTSGDVIGGLAAGESCITDINSQYPITNFGKSVAVPMFQGMLSTYFNKLNGTLVLSEDTPTTTDDLNTYIYNVCSLYPGMCDTFLKSYCSALTPELLTNDPSYIKWCGCYMPDSVYSKWTDLYGINLECTPPCNITGNIRVSDEIGLPKKCSQSTCVIDDISLTLAQSTAGTINFNQICGGCNFGTCNCTITGLTIQGISSDFPSINIGNACMGTGSKCYKETSENGVVISQLIDCFDGTLVTNTESDKQKRLRDRNVSAITVIGVTFAIIVIGWLIKSLAVDFMKATTPVDISGLEHPEPVVPYPRMNNKSEFFAKGFPTKYSNTRRFV